MSGEAVVSAGLPAEQQRMALARYALLLLLSLFVTLPGIGALPPTDRDEARFVQATKQMVETGDRVDIRFQDETRYKKPIGIYWLQSAAVGLSGMGETAPIWVYRLVSVLGLATAVLALAWTGTRLFGAQAGFIAGVVLAALFACAFEGRIAKTDATLLGLTVLAQGALAQIYVGLRRNLPVAAGLPWLFWAAQGCGILIKGPIVPLISVLTVLVLLAFDRDRRWLRELKPGRGMLVVVLIVLPWLALISWKSGGAFWQESVGRDLLAKVGGGQESHGAPPGYYVLTYGLMFWPFGVFALGAGLLALRRANADPRLLFCLAWYIPFWLLFECIPTKLPHYTLPAYPALALLAGWATTLATETGPEAFQRWQWWLWLIAAFGHVAVTLALAVAVIAVPIYLEAGLLPVSVVAAAAILITGVLAFPRGAGLQPGRIVAAALTAGVSYALIFWLILPSIGAMWLTSSIASAVEEHRPCPGSVLAAVGYQEPSLVFQLGTGTLLTDLDGAARHLQADPGCALALVPTEAQAELAARLGAAGEIQPVATVTGVNYTTGDRLSLGLYRAME